KARTLMRFGDVAFDLLERAAEPGQGIRRDADAGVGDAEHYAVIGGAAPYRDLAAGWRELDRVRQKIERDLLEGATVGAQMQIGSDAGAERDVLLLGASRHHAHG